MTPQGMCQPVSLRSVQQDCGDFGVTGPNPVGVIQPGSWCKSRDPLAVCGQTHWWTYRRHCGDCWGQGHGWTYRRHCGNARARVLTHEWVPPARATNPKNWRATDPSTGGHHPKNWTPSQLLFNLAGALVYSFLWNFFVWEVVALGRRLVWSLAVWRRRSGLPTSLS